MKEQALWLALLPPETLKKSNQLSLLFYLEITSLYITSSVYRLLQTV